MQPNVCEWRYFKPEEIRDALMWAGKGGISVFEPSGQLHSPPSARLLAEDINTLYTAACQLGLAAELVQVRPHVPELTHFVLSGEFLDKARGKCPTRFGAKRVGG